MTIWFAHCFVPGPGYGLLCPVLSSRARACRRDRRTPSAPLPDVGVAFVRETFPPPAETLLSGHRSYEHMCQSRVALLCFGSSPRSRNLCRLLLAPAAIRIFSTLFCESFLGCLVPYPGGHRVHAPVNFPDVIGLPQERLGRLTATFHERNFSWE